MKTPYKITSKILDLVASISAKIGEVNAAYLYKPPKELKRKNRIRTIQSTLEIDGNSLSFSQVAAIIDKKRISAPPKDILEVKNAVKVYDNLAMFKPASITSFCKAHAILMNGLVKYPGKIRTSSAGIIKGAKVTRVPTPGNTVRFLVKTLFDYLKKDKDLPLIKSCVFHHKVESIHPFIDGNGRMGRLWQTLILKQYSPVFEFLPVETFIKARESEYRKILVESGDKGDSSGFIEFMLQIIDESLEDLLTNQSVSLTGRDRILIFKEKAGKEQFTRQGYMRHFKDISTATASRDLKLATDEGILTKKGDKVTTIYRFRK